MKFQFLVLAVVLVPSFSWGQTELNKTYPVQNGQSIVMHFDYPELVQVSTWDRNEVSIQGSVSINGGENDDAFIIENSTEGGRLSIRSYIKDLKRLPERVTVYRDGQKIIFKDKAEMKKFQQEQGGGFNTMSFGPEIDIVLQ